MNRTASSELLFNVSVDRFLRLRDLKPSKLETLRNSPFPTVYGQIPLWSCHLEGCLLTAFQAFNEDLAAGARHESKLVRTE